MSLKICECSAVKTSLVVDAGHESLYDIRVGHRRAACGAGLENEAL